MLPDKDVVISIVLPDKKSLAFSISYPTYCVLKVSTQFLIKIFLGIVTQHYSLDEILI